MQSIRAVSLALILAALPLAAATSLAPTGTLRATFLGNNPVQGRVDPQTGAVTGPVADLVKELARQLNVPFTITPATNAADVLARIEAHTADLGFLAWDKDRASEVDFSQPWALMNNSYIVRPGSLLHTSADVDRQGVRVAGVRGQTPEIWLEQNLKNTKVIVLDDLPATGKLVQMFSTGEIDALGVNRGRAVELAAATPALVALPDSYSSVEQSLVVAKGNSEGVAVLNKFINEKRAAGFIEESLQRAKVAGVQVAPAK